MRKKFWVELSGITLASLLITVWLVPMAFHDAARERYIEKEKGTFATQIDAAMEALEDQYALDEAKYEIDHAAWETDYAAWEKYCAAYELEVQEYEAEFEKLTAEYEQECRKYDSDVQNYKKAKEWLTEQTENKILAGGITFTVGTSISREYNNHVGNEWSYQFGIDGYQVRQGDRLVVKWGSGINFTTIAVEDDKVPDVGRTDQWYTPKKEDFKTGFTLENTVIVYENRGRYAGNSAKYIMTLTMKPDPYTVTIDESKLPNLPKRPQKPVYSPPAMTMDEPIEPVAPTFPTKAMTGLAEPNWSNVDVNILGVYRYSSGAILLLVIVWITSGAGSYLLVRKEKETPHD